MQDFKEKYRKMNNSKKNLIIDRKLMFYPNKKNALGHFQLRKKEYRDKIDIQE